MCFKQNMNKYFFLLFGDKRFPSLSSLMGMGTVCFIEPVVLFVVLLYIPVNNCSVMSG